MQIRYLRALFEEMFVPAMGLRKEEVKGVKDLADSGIDSVPHFYVRPVHERPSKSISSNSLLQQIPVIDLNNLNSVDRASLVAAIADACKNWGFFQVINHGIPNETLHGMIKVAHQFFELPMHEKMAYHSKNVSKYLNSAQYGTSFNPEAERVPDWRDVLRHSGGPLPEIIETWPNEPAPYRETAAKYCKGMKVVAEFLLGLISESLGLDCDYLKKAFGGCPQQKVLVNYYPPCPNPDLVLGLSSHHDGGGITILLQDGTAGLECLHEGQWVQIEPTENALIINVADQIQVWSNDRYQSVEHRAVVNSTKTRVSVVTFYNPDGNSVVAPIRELVDEEHPAVYRGHLFHEYRKAHDRKRQDSVPTCLPDFKIKHPSSNIQCGTT